ncbi:MAG: prolipoprotein diacylglyceryl transferase [Pseudomonadota bacterium]|jgi:phosphatidylglycerol:prolipoprotein diacylglycerol transferase
MLPYPNIDPAIFSIGPFQLRWYSMMYIIGLLAVFLFLRRASRTGRLQMDHEQLETCLVYGLVGMILGARTAYVFIYNFDYYWNNWKEIPAIWQGGLSFHGGLLGSILALFIFARRNRIDFMNLTDHIAAIIPVGLGFGRIGNFINGELWGRVTDVPWAMVFPTGGPLPRHPSQLYESMLEGWLLLALMLYVYSRKPKTGVVSAVFLLGYASFRFVAEFFREPDAQLGTVLGPFSMGQLLCALMWIFGVCVLMVARSRPSSHQAATPAAGT